MGHNSNIFNKLWRMGVSPKLKEYGIGDVTFDEGKNGELFISNIDGKLPNTIKVNDVWNDYRYYIPQYLILKFARKLAKYSGLTNLLYYPDFFGKYEDKYVWKSKVDAADFERTSKDKNGELVLSPLFVYVNGGSYAISKMSGRSYPVYVNGTIDSDEGYHLSEIESPDWWEELSDEDRAEIEKYFG